MAAKILTANKLGDGRVVWYTKDHEWSENAQYALLATTSQDIAVLEEALKVGLSNNLVIDANLIDVDDQKPHYRPLRLRERIRQNGPTIAYGTTPTNIEAQNN